MKSDKKSFSVYVKSKSKARETIGPLTDGSNLTYDYGEMSTILNNYFMSVFTTDPPADVAYMDKNNGKIVSDILITPEIVRKTIDSLKPSTSKDPNGFTNKFLKDFKNDLKVPLSLLFNKMMQTGQVPEDWRTAHVTPIFKKRSKESTKQLQTHITY